MPSVLDLHQTLCFARPACSPLADWNHAFVANTFASFACSLADMADVLLICCHIVLLLSIMQPICDPPLPLIFLGLAMLMHCAGVHGTVSQYHAQRPGLGKPYLQTEYSAVGLPSLPSYCPGN